VMPRISPASAPMTIASATVSGAKEATVHGYGFPSDERSGVGG
jgi:hypothetical protein